MAATDRFRFRAGMPVALRAAMLFVLAALSLTAASGVFLATCRLRPR